MHIHILGICGTFMGGLAVLARAAGHRVTGCDAGVYPPMSTQLAEQGIELIEGFDAAQLATLQPDVFVVGNVVSRGNPLMEAILDAGLPYVSGPQWLAEHVLAGKHVLAVAGTHGKTTTSAMLAWVLEQQGLAPGFLIGGVPVDFGISARLTDSRFFVIEADEYDTAFFDKRSKFVHYRPRTLILNNLEYDHADIFPDLAAIQTQCHHLVRTIAQHGRIVSNGRESALEAVLMRGCWSEVERFGVAGGWEARGADQVCDVYWQGRRVAEFDAPMQGEHNRLNALAAIAAARHVGIPPAAAGAALAAFKGVKRRMEIRGSVDGITVYDDFAHHPTAIQATLEGLRKRLGLAALDASPALANNTDASTAAHADGAPRGRILAVLEPRSNTMKLGVMSARLPASLAAADAVFAYQAPAGRDALDWNLAQVLAPLGQRARAFTDLGALTAAVVASAAPGDHVVVMSNGGFGGVHGRLLNALDARVQQERS
ncbi:MAG: UDP-N-acetylmuramate:L-alanyl-gamma-D-glutamyl-meso-diaminopimelate ligase [Janthinobacterium lividum]